MRIDLQKPYKSIAGLTTGELPDFAVLIGRNGAGKTQVLEALKEGHAEVSGIRVEDIELYDMNSFRAPNVNVGNRGFNQFGSATADAFLLAPPGKQSAIETAAEIFDEFVREREAESGGDGREEFVGSLMDEVRRMPDFKFFVPAPARSSPYQQALFKRVMARFVPKPLERKRNRQPAAPPPNSYNGNQAALLSTAMKLADKLPHELNRDDIIRASNYEGPTLANLISGAFAAYKVDQFIWAHTRIETESVEFQGPRR